MAAPQSTECGAFSGGLAVNLMYAAGENLTGSSSGGEAYGGSVVYKGGPLVVQGYYQVGTVGPVSGVSTNDVDVDQYGVGAGWNFGMFRVAGNWGEAKLSPQTGSDIKNQGWALGGAMKLGGGEILLNFIHRQISGVQSILNVDQDPKATTWGVAYTYPLSKRTNVYASYGMTDNNSAGAYALNYSQGRLLPNNGGSDAIGSDLRAFAVGVRHLF
jgi:predicted porin